MKAKELIGIRTEFLQKGFTSFITKFGQSKFMIGRLKDRNLDEFAEGNFECAEVQKGVPRDDWEWTTEKYNTAVFTTQHSYKVMLKGEEKYLELTWSQNEKLKKVATSFPCFIETQEEDTGYENKSVSFTLVESGPVKTEPEAVPGDTISVEDLPF